MPQSLHYISYNHVINYIHQFANTGMVPEIYDNATHYVVNHKITLETLEGIQKYPDVEEIKGDYSGIAASKGSVHERGERD
jgi:hypothetical protein